MHDCKCVLVMARFSKRIRILFSFFPASTLRCGFVRGNALVYHLVMKKRFSSTYSWVNDFVWLQLTHLLCIHIHDLREFNQFTFIQSCLVQRSNLKAAKVSLCDYCGFPQNFYFKFFLLLLLYFKRSPSSAGWTLSRGQNTLLCENFIVGRDIFFS